MKETREDEPCVVPTRRAGERELEGNMAEVKVKRRAKRKEWKEKKIDSVEAKDFGVHHFQLLWNEIFPKKYCIGEISSKGQVSYHGAVAGLINRIGREEIENFLTWLRDNWPHFKRHPATEWIHERHHNLYNFPDLIAVLRFWDSFASLWVDCTSTEEQYADYHQMEAARKRMAAERQKIEEQIQLARKVDNLTAENSRLMKRVDYYKAAYEHRGRQLGELYVKYPAEDPLNEED